jgi:hypothetical protein
LGAVVNLDALTDHRLKAGVAHGAGHGGGVTDRCHGWFVPPRHAADTHAGRRAAHHGGPECFAFGTPRATRPWTSGTPGEPVPALTRRPETAKESTRQRARVPRPARRRRSARRRPGGAFAVGPVRWGLYGRGVQTLKTSRQRAGSVGIPTATENEPFR